MTFLDVTLDQLFEMGLEPAVELFEFIIFRVAS